MGWAFERKSSLTLFHINCQGGFMSLSNFLMLPSTLWCYFVVVQQHLMLPGSSLESRSRLSSSSLQTQGKDRRCWHDLLQWPSSSTTDQNHSIVTKSGTFTKAPAGLSVSYYEMYHTWGSVRRNDLLNSSNLMSENWFRPTRFENERLCENNRPPEW